MLWCHAVSQWTAQWKCRVEGHHLRLTGLRGIKVTRKSIQGASGHPAVSVYSLAVSPAIMQEFQLLFHCSYIKSVFLCDYLPPPGRLLGSCSKAAKHANTEVVRQCLFKPGAASLIHETCINSSTRECLSITASSWCLLVVTWCKRHLFGRMLLFAFFSHLLPFFLENQVM